jgi:hypothetical protein
MGSGFKNFTATVLTASDVNNFLMEQSVMSFVSNGARDVAITAPEDGMVAYIRSNDSSEGLYTYNGTSWRKGPGWNAPWGLLAKDKKTNNSVTSANHTTLQDGTNTLTVTATTVTNRCYKITTIQNPYASGGANGFQGAHLVGGTETARFLIPTMSTVTQDTRTYTSTFTETSGQSRIFKAQISSYATNTQITDWGSATIPRVIIVEDIGPDGVPA